MKLKLLRSTEGHTFTEGKLFIDDVMECYTIEDTDRHLEDNQEEKIYGMTAIPRGLYHIEITRSSRFKKDLIAINNVPFFRGIRIHTGNSSKDTDGCVIVGSTNRQDDDDWVGGSKVAYKALHAKVKNALDRKENVTIEIV